MVSPFILVVYYAINVSGASGSRPQLRVADISATTTPTGVENTASVKQRLLAYPNPSKAGSSLHFNQIISGRMLYMYGRTVQHINQANVVETNMLAAGIYNIITTSDERIRIAID